MKNTFMVALLAVILLSCNRGSDTIKIGAAVTMQIPSNLSLKLWQPKTLMGLSLYRLM